jgi:hypothetical protein
MVHVVQGHQYTSAYTVYGASIAAEVPILRPILNLDSDKFQYFNHRDELDNTVQLPTDFKSIGMMCAIKSI